MDVIKHEILFKTLVWNGPVLAAFRLAQNWSKCNIFSTLKYSTLFSKKVITTMVIRLLDDPAWSVQSVCVRQFVTVSEWFCWLQKRFRPPVRSRYDDKYCSRSYRFIERQKLLIWMFVTFLLLWTIKINHVLVQLKKAYVSFVVKIVGFSDVADIASKLSALFQSCQCLLGHSCNSQDTRHSSRTS